LTGLIQAADGVEVRRVDFRNGEQLEEQNVSCSQSVLESALRKKIDSSCFLQGVDFQRFEQDGKNIRVCAVGKDGEHYEIVGRVLIGADGAKSHVREQLQISFEGETTVELSFSFDVNYVGGVPLSSNIFYLLSHGPKRLVLSPIKSVPPRFKASGTLVSLLEGFDDNEVKRMDEEVVLPRLLESIQHGFNLYFDPESVSGVTFYRTQSRMADRFENFPVLLIGDAAHAFWPAGGYGLNLAIKEGVQLACTIAKHQNLGEDAFKAAVCQFAAERREKALIIQADTQLKKEKYADNSKANQAEREDQIDLE
jgi:2-polyprenyl-6-methoxyphenol hydroxylase-like FAD-dependent oxidoreductase